MASDSIRVGIIGCGDLGVTHAQRLAAIDGVEVSALCDPRAAAVARAAEALPRAPVLCTDDDGELLAAPLDAVCIASPDSLHVRQVLGALDCGLHVLCEKPLTLDPAALEEVVAAHQRSGLVVSMTNPRRHDGGIRAIHREIASGRWGDVRTVLIRNAEDWITPNAGTWRHNPHMCPGGFVYDAGIHQLDTVMWCTGLQAEEVRAESEDRGTGVPMVTWGTARLQGGVPMTFAFIGDAHAWRENVAIHCDRMDFEIANYVACWSPEGRAVPIEPREPEEHADTIFIRILREGGTPYAEPASLAPVLQFTVAALESARTGGRTVWVPRAAA